MVIDSVFIPQYIIRLIPGGEVRLLGMGDMDNGL